MFKNPASAAIGKTFSEGVRESLRHSTDQTLAKKTLKGKKLFGYAIRYFLSSFCF